MRLSIIIPVYNIEKYIADCLDSVLKQKKSDYEIILVVDGSTDNSLEICKEYEFDNDCIKVIEQINMGLSMARNNGVKEAKGEYILFLDGDDSIADNALDVFDNIRDDVDVIAFNWIEKCNEKIKKVSNYNNLKSYYMTGDEFIEDLLTDNYISPWYAWRYAYNRKFWCDNGFEFPKNKNYEDIWTIPNVLLRANGIITINKYIYIYRKERAGSITTKISVKNEIDKIDAVSKNIKEFEKNTQITERVKNILENTMSCLFYSSMINCSMLDEKEERDILIRKLKRNSWICNYTQAKKQIIVAKMIRLLGIDNVIKLLNIRRKIKLWI